MSRISVIIPCLNDEAYIREALESVFAQTRAPDEIIVADGGSSDGTPAILDSFRDRVTWFVQEGKGVSKAKNQAVARASGDYIAFLDADDRWYPAKLEKQAALLDSHPEYGFCSSDVDFFNGTGIIIRGAIGKEKKPRSGEVFDELLVNNFISSATIFLRKEVFERVGGFDEEIFYAEDTEMWLRSAREFRLGYIPEVLSAYRVRGESRSGRFALHYGSLEKTFARFEERDPEYFRSRPGLLPAARAHLYRRWGWRHFQAGEYREARGLFLKLLRQKPGSGFAWKYLALSCLPPALVARARLLRARGMEHGA